MKKDTAYKIGAVFLALLFWQIIAMRIHQSILLVSPVEVAARLLTIWREKEFFPSVLYSLGHVLAGFGLGFFCGTGLAILAFHSKAARYLIQPWMSAAKAVPVAAITVICLIWLSNRNLSIFISFLIVLPVIYHNMLTGLDSQDQGMTEMVRLFHFRKIDAFRYVLLPQLVPYLLSSCKTAIGMAWKAGIAAEIIGTPAGSIGKLMYTAKIYLDTDDLLAWTVVTVLLSILTEKCFLFLLEKWLFPVWTGAGIGRTGYMAGKLG